MINDNVTTSNERHIFSVSELNLFAKNLLENTLPSLWLEGEISNLAQPRSGHIYLTLKDDNAQVRCAMFKGRNMRLRFRPANGQQVLVKGRLSLYTPRGDYQLIIDSMEEAGLGALQRAFEQLKAKLHHEGLFDDSQKQPIPEHPTAIGVITSPTGAAVQDITSVLARRFPLVPVTLYPVAVQGTDAPAQLINAINTANRRNECDVLIVGRGGGSLEDLWAFNDEQLARTISASNIPIVSAVGHQVDYTIADFVADLRAPTPSAAAEMLSQDQDELRDTFAGYQHWFEEKIQLIIAQHTQTLAWLEKQLVHPGKRLEEHSQRLDDLENRLILQMRQTLALAHAELGTLSAQLLAQTPYHQLEQLSLRVDALRQRSEVACQQSIKDAERSLSHLAHRLETVSPLATLSRGYSITKNAKNTLIRTRKDVSVGEVITTDLGDGTLTSEVTSVD
ncbi:exodeoxyribonuclease VII large subunit [Gammaproteobacteria bacterium 45_16_T64]|nr:exodeoxyribonuclease VII large subunit [Gammaproteobacteria bacterium 45_16_T64]